MSNDKPDRITMATDRAAFRTPTADSLVGLYFHSDAERGWQGCVIARPEPGFYLVETFDWIIGQSHSQHLVRIEDMLAWQFYDTAKWMNNMHCDGVNGEWRARRSNDT